MSSVPVVTSEVRTQTTRRPKPLLSVMLWELRRFRASRVFWLQLLIVFCFLVLLTWVEALSYQIPVPDRAGAPTSASAFIPGTSAWGLLVNLPTTLVVLVVLLPFVTADGVARDLQRRTHELLMSSAVPSWAYVWGRYLIGLLMSLGLAVLLLAAILGVGTVMHRTIANYPAPELGTVLVLWVGMVVPATVLVSSVGFAIVTLFPRLSMAVKIVLLVAWAVGALVLSSLIIHLWTRPNGVPTGYSAWDPTSAVTAHTLLQQQYPLNFGPRNPLPATPAQFQQLLNTIANTVPAVSGWLAPHLIEAALSVLLVAVAAFTFQRFRNVVGA